MTATIRKNFRVLERPVEGSNKLLFIYTAMGTKMNIYKWFVLGLNRRGYSCIIYDYSMKPIYEAHPKEWEEWYEALMDDAHKRLNKYKNAGIKHFYAYGVSMGTLIANRLARETPDITHIVLNLTYGDVMSTVFTWKGIRKAKTTLIRSGYDLKAAQELARSIDPVFNAQNLKGKKVLLFLAHHDHVLRWKYTRDTLRAFQAANIDMEYVENKYLGHFLAGSKNMVNLNRLDRFYAKKVKIIR